MMAHGCSVVFRRARLAARRFGEATGLNALSNAPFAICASARIGREIVPWSAAERRYATSNDTPITSAAMAAASRSVPYTAVRSDWR